MAMTVNPTAAIDTAAPFRDEALYGFRFDTDGDTHEDVSFKVRFGDVGHTADGHAQTFELRLADGADAATGDGGRVVVSGTTGATVHGENGARIICRGRQRCVRRLTPPPSPHSRTPTWPAPTTPRPSTTTSTSSPVVPVAAIVVEAPNALIGADTMVQA